MPNVFILILHWQNHDVTQECLESFRTLDYKNAEVVVLDNASTNDSARRLEKEFPEFTFIFNEKNNGYGAGMNPGITYAMDHGADYIFLLNNDVIVNQPDFLTKLVQFMEDTPHAGIVGPKLLFPDGRYQKSYNKHILAMALEPWWPAKATTLLRKIGFARSRENDVFRVGWLNAVALLFKRRVFEDIGIMDELYFLGAEDIDLSLRAKRKGWETWYYPKAELIHASFVSHAKSAIAYDRHYAASTVQFLYKHYAWPIAVLLRVVTALGFFFRAAEWFVVSIINRKKYRVARELFTMGKAILFAPSK